jgi:hypothetical protein
MDIIFQKETWKKIKLWGSSPFTDCDDPTRDEIQLHCENVEMVLSQNLEKYYNSLLGKAENLPYK